MTPRNRDRIPLRRSSMDSSTGSHTSDPDENFEGAECAIQTLYEGLSVCVCCKNWTTKYPEDIRIPVEQQSQTKHKALVARMAKNHDDDDDDDGGGKPLVLDSIVVQSPCLRETLTEVFRGYRGITASLKKLVFKAPFHAFYHRWGVLCEVLERQKREDPDTAAYTQLLHDLLNVELEDIRTEIEDLISHGCITYSLLWALFEPGTRIVRTKGEHTRFYITGDYEYRVAHDDERDVRNELEIVMQYVEFDGKRFGFAETEVFIPTFQGTRAIDELECFPASFLASREETEAKAIARGRRFQDLQGVHYLGYSGMARLTRRRRMERHIDGRIMVDAAAFFNANSGERQYLGALDAALPEINVADDVHGRAPPFNRRRMPRNRRGGRRNRALRRMHSPVDYYSSDDEGLEETVVVTMKPNTDPKPDLTEEQLLLCNSHVRGYSLKFKHWVTLDVDSISDVAWNDEAFPNLMLPDGFKSLILSFVESQSVDAEDKDEDEDKDKEDTFDDIIEGKGLGVIMLLVGNPGTGKTLTAEAVADKVRRPLYVLSAGELGENVRDVESRLERVLALAERWNAVLLFDECDVFLQERSMGDLRHNEIVSVFLRILEYYRGILMMTSNRADTIDHAFYSRVHLTLQYPDLDSTTRADIWRRFSTQRRTTSALTDEDYARLADLPLNGRQIRNVIKIAMRLALQEKKPMGIEQVKTVFRATGSSLL